jgi:hypothetical protein
MTEPTPRSKPADDPIGDHVRRLIDGMPPLTDAQRDRLAGLLRLMPVTPRRRRPVGRTRRTG